MIAYKLKVEIAPGRHFRDNLISAYSKSISGTEMTYHCYHPEAEAALLIRAREGMNRMQWQSAAISQGIVNPLFVFLCAIPTSQGGGHEFHLKANGQDLISFYSPKLGEQIFESIVSPSGASLRFEKHSTDCYGDFFGLMYLTIPQDINVYNERVDFELFTPPADSDDWVMIFKYEFSPLPHIKWEPILLKTEQGHYQGMKIVYDHIYGASEIRVISMDFVQTVKPDKHGLYIDYIAVPCSETAYPLTVEYYLDKEYVSSLPLSVSPTVPRDVYILPFSHNDIGYTDYQEDVRQKQYQNIAMALSMIKTHQAKPDEAMPRWNLEVLWALQSWWESATKASRDEFVAAVKADHIGLNALHNNLLSGLCNDLELSKHLDFAGEFSQLAGIHIDTAAITDIPGFAWGLIKAMYDSGVRYFAIAPNSGDRVGHIYDMADKPFYWSSPDGKAQVLTWILGAGYAMFHREKLSETGIKKVFNYLTKLQSEAYPYPLIPLAYTIGGDNGSPDPDLPDFVNYWNKRFASPRFIISTHKKFFNEFSAKFGIEIPIMKGDLSPYWEDGAASSALETKLNRNAADRLKILENLYKTHYKDMFPTAAFKQAWHKVILFDEHTWGAWDSIANPDSDFVTRQWNFKQALAMDADRLSKKLMQDFVMMDCFAKQILKEEAPEPMQDLPLSKEKDLSIETPWAKLVFDISSCSISSFYLKDQEVELLRASQRLLQYLYMKADDRDNLLGLKDGKLISHKRSQEFCEILMQADAPYCHSYKVKIRVHYHQPKLDVEIFMDKMAVRDKESIHIAFPFYLEDALLRYDSAGALIHPEIDQLPGACKNFFCPTGIVDISNQDIGLSVSLIDNPLIEIGGITAELPWMHHIDASTVFYAYLMNNYWHTNYKADQSGAVSFRFCIRLHGQCDDNEILKYSRC